jgi:hypothetical protein
MHERLLQKGAALSKPGGELDIAATAMAWAAGWALTRGKTPPVSRPYGCKIDLGSPEHLQRHVVLRDDATMLRELVDTLQVPGTWLKVCAPLDKVAPYLSGHWQVQPPEYLMAVSLHDAAAIVADGYRLLLTSSGEVSDAECRDSEGQLAARGRVAHCDGFATFDQIVTEPGHQRKGLGRAVMAVLGNLSIAHAGNVGVLVATEQGRALYEALGWSMVSPVTAAVIDG